MMLSIVLPVYNRILQLSEGLEKLKSRLDQMQCTYEIIIIDDGSAAKEEVQAIAVQHQCICLRNEVNAGKGKSVKRGVLAATGNLIIFMDGDFPFDLSIIETMYQCLRENDVVIGDRTLPGSSYVKESVVLRKAGSRILSAIIRKFYLKGISDSQCGIKGFRSDAGKAIFSKVTFSRFSFDVEALFIATHNQFTIGRLPVHVYEQDGSSVNVLKDGLGMMLSLIKIKLNHAKGKYRINE
ncbi:glycosyltransferase [Pseudoflavitalea rhizosphaerae]|uniref:glycosyltransferase n=1 Tax=Pseudoflavitalea rhizosphaerae TaxID=1884793 RepID=UPI000F8F32F0|nr:glycosyltransferase [Pseudoflavitalea rhizosphaerae]